MRQSNALMGLKRVGNARFPIYGTSCSNGAFNAPIDALPLQIGVGVSIAISFTFSQSFLTPTILHFLFFRELSFQMSHRRPLTLRRLSIFQ